MPSVLSSLCSSVVRTRLTSLATAGVLVAGGLALAPSPAQAASTSATYSCTSSKPGLAGVAIPLTVALDDVTQPLVVGTPLEPGIHTTIDAVGSTVGSLLAVVDEVLGGVLGLLGDLLGGIFGLTPSQKANPVDAVTAVPLSLVNQLGQAVSTVTAQLKLTSTVGAVAGELNPLVMTLTGGGLGGLVPNAAGTYAITAPSTLQLDLGSGATSDPLSCVVSSAVGGVVTLVSGITARGTEVTLPDLSGGKSGNVALPGAQAGANPCTATLPKVGSRKTTLRLTLAKKRIKKSARAKLGATATYRLKGKKRKASGYALVCDGTKALGVATVKRGGFRVTLPKLAPGRHRLLVRYVGAGKAKPANKRIVLTVKR